MAQIIITAIICFPAGMITCAVLLKREIRLLGNLIAMTTEPRT